MISILLVDDEIASLNGLKNGVDWQGLGIGTVHTAQNAEQARQVFACQAVDLMLCDIEMPRESGLQLMEWVVQNHPDAVFLFYTCHDRFDFVQRALRLGAFDYLLKPFPYGKLEQVLERALEKLRAQRLSGEFVRYGERWLESREQVAETFFHTLMRDEMPGGPAAVQAELRRAGLDARPDTWTVAVLCRVSLSKQLAGEWRRADFLYAVHNMARELFSARGGQAITLTEGDNDVLAFVLYPRAGDNPGTEDALQAAGQLADNIRQYLGSGVRCVVGRPLPLAQCAGVYFRLQNALANVVEENRVLLLEEAEEQQDLPDGGDYGFDAESWRLLVRENRPDALFQAVCRHMDARAGRQKTGRAYLQALYHSFLQALYGGLEDRGITSEVLFSGADMQAKSLAALQSIEAMKEFVHSAAQDAAGAMAQLDNTGSIVDRVKQYIDAHLGDELDRDSLAAHVFIDPAYLSRLFKKETGGLLSEYITERRMERAKKLLRETDLPISTIAIHLGYTNMPYFSRSFKKSTGRAPGEYREAIQAS